MKKSYRGQIVALILAMSIAGCIGYFIVSPFAFVMGMGIGVWFVIPGIKYDANRERKMNG